jgi:putative tricarboxylic transport membrane protein
MQLDKLIALIFMVISVIYGYTAYNFPLLPFERNMPFLPNTMPMALSVLGVLISLIILFSKSELSEDNDSEMSIKNLRYYKTGQASAILGAMVIYALALRTLGFIPSTILFLFISSWILGERKIFKMIIVAILGTVPIWYVVQEVLGIFLKPLPW